MNPLYMIFGPVVLAALVGIFFKEDFLAKIISLVLFVSMLIWSVSMLDTASINSFSLLGTYIHCNLIPIDLTLQVDRLSAVMLILTFLLLILVTLSSWNIKSSAYFALLIMFAGPITGVFLSTNLIWFFIFWELTLIPMFFLIGIWGAEGRIYASIKFFLYTHFASMLILLAFFLIYKQSGIMDISMIKESMLATPALIWWLMFIGFAVKMPIFPFHTWLPDAHVQAPAPISVLLAGVLLKMGAYAMIRFAIIMMPQTAEKYSYIILILGLITLFYAGFNALYERHIKKMVAYSSISHMGLVAVAISTVTYAGLSASLFEMIAHALVISPLFLIAGLLHERTGSWYMKDMGGLMQKAPFISTVFVLASLAALGLPGTVGFIGELSILIASIQKYGLWLAVIAIGSIIGAGYLIWTLRRVIYGEISDSVKTSNFRICKTRVFALLIFALLIIIFGLFPSILFDIIDPAFQAFNHTGGAL